MKWSVFFNKKFIFLVTCFISAMLIIKLTIDMGNTGSEAVKVIIYLIAMLVFMISGLIYVSTEKKPQDDSQSPKGIRK